MPAGDSKAGRRRNHEYRGKTGYSEDQSKPPRQVEAVARTRFIDASKWVGVAFVHLLFDIWDFSEALPASSPTETARDRATNT